MENGIKIYGLCLERLKYQIGTVKQKLRGAAKGEERIVLLESYGTRDLEDIIDILEIRDLEEKNLNALSDKLSKVGYTVSAVTGENISFGFTDEGHLGLYLTLNDNIDNIEYPTEKTFQDDGSLNSCITSCMWR